MSTRGITHSAVSVRARPSAIRLRAEAGQVKLRPGRLRAAARAREQRMRTSPRSTRRPELDPRQSCARPASDDEGLRERARAGGGLGKKDSRRSPCAAAPDVVVALRPQASVVCAGRACWVEAEAAR